MDFNNLDNKQVALNIKQKGIVRASPPIENPCPSPVSNPDERNDDIIINFIMNQGQ